MWFHTCHFQCSYFCKEKTRKNLETILSGLCGSIQFQKLDLWLFKCCYQDVSQLSHQIFRKPTVNCTACMLGATQKEAVPPNSHLYQTNEWKSRTQVTETGISELSCKPASGPGCEKIL